MTLEKDWEAKSWEVQAQKLQNGRFPCAQLAAVGVFPAVHANGLVKAASGAARLLDSMMHTSVQCDHLRFVLAQTNALDR